MSDTSHLYEITSVVRDCHTGRISTVKSLVSINTEAITLTIQVTHEDAMKVISYAHDQCRPLQDVLEHAVPYRRQP